MSDKIAATAGQNGGEANIHRLKTWPMYFDQVLDGVKTFEIRKDDRGFNPGDVLRLEEFGHKEDDQEMCYTGRSVDYRVTYITDFGQQPGFVVMAIKPVNDPAIKALAGMDAELAADRLCGCGYGHIGHLTGCPSLTTKKPQ